MEERIKELFSNEEYINELFALGSYEKAAEKLNQDGVDVSVDELKKCVEIIRKKQSGELSDEDLEDVAGGFVVPAILTGIVVVIGVPTCIAVETC